MKLNTEQSNAHALLKEAVILLCKQLLTYSTSLSIKAVVGITTDDVKGFYFDINENIKGDSKTADEIHSNRSSTKAADSDNKYDAQQKSKLIEEHVKSKLTEEHVKSCSMSKEDSNPNLLFSLPSLERKCIETNILGNTHIDSSAVGKKDMCTKKTKKKRSQDEDIDFYPGKRKRVEERRVYSPITASLSDKTECSSPQIYMTTTGDSNERKEENEMLRKVCSRCSSTFTSESQYKSHLLLHSQCRPFKCHKCLSVVQHNQCNHLMCEKCNTQYSCKFNEHVCYKCGKSFSGITKLLIHIRSCNGDSTMNISLLKPDIKPILINLFAEPKVKLKSYQQESTEKLLHPKVNIISSEQQICEDKDIPKNLSGKLDLSIDTSLQSSRTGFQSVQSAKPNSLLMNLILTSDVKSVPSPEGQSVKFIEVKPQSPVSEPEIQRTVSSPEQLSPFESAQKLLDKVFLKTGNVDNETIYDCSNDKTGELTEFKPNIVSSVSTNDNLSIDCHKESDVLNKRNDGELTKFKPEIVSSVSNNDNLSTDCHEEMSNNDNLSIDCHEDSDALHIRDDETSTGDRFNNDNINEENFILINNVDEEKIKVEET